MNADMLKMVEHLQTKKPFCGIENPSLATFTWWSHCSQCTWAGQDFHQMVVRFSPGSAIKLDFQVVFQVVFHHLVVVSYTFNKRSPGGCPTFTR